MSYAENGYGTDYFLLYGPNTDVEVVQNTTDADTPNLCRYSISPTVAKLDIPSTTGIFGGNFRGIERANIALRGLEQYGNIGENKNMAALYGEALFTDMHLVPGKGDLPREFHRRIKSLDCFKLLEQNSTDAEVGEGLDFIASL